MTEILQGIAQSIVEGLTEFLPVSSTGHMILLGDIIGFQDERAHTFEIFIQLGAILSIVVLYFGRFRNLLTASAEPSTSENGFSGRVGIQKLFVACLPAFVLGFLLHHFIKERLFTPHVVASSLIVGGLVMIAIEAMKIRPVCESIENITYKQSFIIGCFQCLALIPGTSRSGATIVGALLLNIERETAAEFSFLLAVPTMCAAVGYDMLKSVKFLHTEDASLFAIGFAGAFVTALLAVRIFIALLNRWTLKPFGFYRIALGALVLWLM